MLNLPSPIKNTFVLSFFESELNKSTHHIWMLNPLNLINLEQQLFPPHLLQPPPHEILFLFSATDLFWKCMDCPVECTTLWIFQLVSFMSLTYS